MNQSISEIVKALPETENVTQLQDRLNAVGIKEDLAALPAAQVSEKFKQLIGDFLTRPIGEISIEQIQALTALVKEADNTLETTPLVKDQTFTYRVAGPTTAQTQESHIREKLGADAEVLIEGLKYIGVDVWVKAPILNEATLDTGSNNKTRAEQNRHYEGGLADPIQAINIAIEAICAAKKAGLDLRTINSESWEEKGSRIKAEALKAGLDEGTATLLEKLTAGIIRVGGGSGSGALNVNDDGRLYANDYNDNSNPNNWAFGARPAAELLSPFSFYFGRRLLSQPPSIRPISSVIA